MPPLTEQFLPQGSIMIVDDNPANLKLLEEMLRQQGHSVHSFPRGRMALAEAARQPPDLILLDINMPEMNGYEVCDQLKATEKLREIPIIFLSALTETEDKVRAFRSGAVDYISKPFRFEEVQARVETHLKLHHLQRALKSHNEHLEETVATRTRELAAANQRLTILDRSKNEFLQLISHELRTPLHGLLSVSELILDELSSANLGPELQKVFEVSRQRILSTLDDSLLLTQIDVGGEQFKSGPLCLSATLNRALENAAAFAHSRDVTLPPPSTNLGLVVGDKELLTRALHALLETAVKFSEKGRDVQLEHEELPGLLKMIIDSRGKTIPLTALPMFFELFSIAETSTPGGDLGLGPAVASRILALFGAAVSVANRDPAGIRLTLSLQACASEPRRNEGASGAGPRPKLPPFPPSTLVQ